MIVTFYSFKGGVGRSMAVANVADILARQGLKVLAIDFDLEAPGLEQYFQIDHRSARRSPGLLDLLLSYKQWMSVAAPPSEEPAFRQLDSFILPIYQKLGEHGRLDLLHAGRREPKEQMDRYASALRSFDWQDFYFNWDGEVFFEYLRNQFAPPRYDLVLVDSRTGVTEMGGICTYQLADVIVLLTGANHQNRHGTLEVVRDYESLPVTTRRDRPVEMVVVPARVEQRDPRLLAEFLERFEAQFADRLPQRLAAAGLTFKDLLIPYEPVYAFEERVLSDPSRVQERREISGAFERLAHAVRLLALPESTSPVSTPAATPAIAYDATRRFAGYDVFLSHAAADAEVVAPLIDLLRQRFRADVFVDTRDLVAGEDWIARTEQALFHSKVCLLCVGPSGLGRLYAQELLGAAEGAAASHELPVIPVLLPGARWPSVDAPRALLVRQALDLSQGLDDPSVAYTLERFFQATLPSAQSATAAVTEGSPYPGARPFTEADADLFFGRTEAIASVLQRIDVGSVVVVGPSACGKSSLVHAGVVPALRRLRTFAVRQLVVGDRAMADLDSALEELESSPGLVLCIVDQLERLLRTGTEETARRFLARLDEVARSQLIRLIVTVRDVRLQALSALAPPTLFAEERCVRLPELTALELRAIVERPAERAGLAFEPGVVDRILSEWGADQRFLPFLQRVLTDLWSRRREGFLTNRAYDEAADPVNACAEAAFGSLGPDLQACAKLVIPRLVTLCANLVPIGLSCSREELLVTGVTGEQLDGLIYHMVDHQLFYAFTDREGSSRLAPAFTSEQWTRVDQWLTEDGEFYAWLSTFHRRRLDYEESLHHSADLLAGPALEQAERQIALRLTRAELDFIDQSRAAGARRRRRQLVNIAVVLLIVVAAVSRVLYVMNQKTTTEVSSADAVRTLSLALANAGKVDDARRGFEDAERLYREAGQEGEALRVRLDRILNEVLRGDRARGRPWFEAAVNEVVARPRDDLTIVLRGLVADVARQLYVAGDAAAAVRGFDAAWQLNDGRPTTANDLVGHRRSLALAAIGRYDLARIAFREAIGGDGHARRPLNTREAAVYFYDTLILAAPHTTQAYENLALLYRERSRLWPAVETIDKGIVVASANDQRILTNLMETRRDILKQVDLRKLADDDPLRGYVCEHNYYVIVATSRTTGYQNDLAQLRRRLPLAEVAPAIGTNVPIIGGFFLTQTEADALVERERPYGLGANRRDWFDECRSAPSPRRGASNQR